MNGIGIYLNEKKELECVNDNDFLFCKSKTSIRDVYAIYNSKDGSLCAGKKYGIFKINSEGEYKIFTEKFIFAYAPQNWFVSIEEWKNYTLETQNEVIDRMKYICEKQDFSIRNEVKKVQEKQKNKEIETINKISQTIAKNTKVSTETKWYYMPKKFCIMLIIYSICGLGLALLMKNVTIGIFAGLMFFLFLIGRKSKQEFIKENYEISIDYYERLNAMNKLPLDMLGKIKQIENYMIIMHYKNVSNEIIKLIEQSINLTVFIPIQDSYYEANKDEIDAKLYEFLNNTLEYIKASLKNKDIEILQLKKGLSEDYLKMIEENSELFSSITKDLNQLSSIWNNK